jgi:hypothetical protein
MGKYLLPFQVCHDLVKYRVDSPPFLTFRIGFQNLHFSVFIGNKGNGTIRMAHQIIRLIGQLILWSFTINTVPITAWSITIYKGKVGKRCYYLLRDDFLKYNRYRRQCDLLWERQITTLDELLTYKENLQAEYNALTAQRKALYRRKSKTTPADYSEQIQALTARIRELRREITTCADIEMDCEMVQDKVQRAAHRRENPPRERIHRRAY